MFSSNLTTTQDYEDFRGHKERLRKFIAKYQGATEVTTGLITSLADLMVNTSAFKDSVAQIICSADQDKEADEQVKRKLAAYQYIYNLFVDTSLESSYQPSKISHNNQYIDHNIATAKRVTGLPLQAGKIKNLMILVGQIYQHHQEQLKSAILTVRTDIPQDAAITITTNGRLSVKHPHASDTGPTTYDGEDRSSNSQSSVLSTQVSTDTFGYGSDSTSCQEDSSAVSSDEEDDLDLAITIPRQAAGATTADYGATLRPDSLTTLTGSFSNTLTPKDNIHGQEKTLVPDETLKDDDDRIFDARTPFHAGVIDIETIALNTDCRDVTKSAHTVMRGFGIDGEVYFCKFSREKKAQYGTIASILAEAWYSKLALVAKTRLITKKDKTTGNVTTIGSASVGLERFTETKTLLDTLLKPDKKELALHTTGSTDASGTDLPDLRKQLAAFLEKYQATLKALENPKADISDELYARFDSDFDEIFTDSISVTIKGKELTLKDLAQSLVYGKAGMDVALMLYPDGDNHQCNNGISTNEHGHFQYSKIDHDYNEPRLQALLRKGSIPDELKCRMNTPIVAALMQGNPLPLQMTRRFDPAKPANDLLRGVHVARKKFANGAKTTTSPPGAYLTRAIQLRYRTLYRQEVQQALSSAISATILTAEEIAKYQDIICKLLSGHVRNPHKEAQAILQCYVEFLSQKQQQLRSILTQMDLTEHPDLRSCLSKPCAYTDDHSKLFTQVSVASTTDESGYLSDTSTSRQSSSSGMSELGDTDTDPDDTPTEHQPPVDHIGYVDTHAEASSAPTVTQDTINHPPQSQHATPLQQVEDDEHALETTTTQTNDTATTDELSELSTTLQATQQPTSLIDLATVDLVTESQKPQEAQQLDQLPSISEQVQAELKREKVALINRLTEWRATIGRDLAKFEPITYPSEQGEQYEKVIIQLDHAQEQASGLIAQASGDDFEPLDSIEQQFNQLQSNTAPIRQAVADLLAADLTYRNSMKQRESTYWQQKQGLIEAADQSVQSLLDREILLSSNNDASRDLVATPQEIVVDTALAKNKFDLLRLTGDRLAQTAQTLIDKNKNSKRRKVIDAVVADEIDNFKSQPFDFDSTFQQLLQAVESKRKSREHRLYFLSKIDKDKLSMTCMLTLLSKTLADSGVCQLTNTSTYTQFSDNDMVSRGNFFKIIENGSFALEGLSQKLSNLKSSSWIKRLFARPSLFKQGITNRFKRQHQQWRQTNESCQTFIQERDTRSTLTEQYEQEYDAGKERARNIWQAAWSSTQETDNYSATPSHESTPQSCKASTPVFNTSCLQTNMLEQEPAAPIQLTG
jgi:hypothetical protein